MITFRTLKYISANEHLEVFNRSFSDYVLPFSLTREELEQKIKSENVKLEFSAGAFEDSQLVAFIPHGYDLVDHIKMYF